MDVELSLIPHFADRESLEVLIQSGVKPHLFKDSNIAEMVDFSYEYFRSSRLEKAPTREILEDEFKEFFDTQDWPEEKYLVTHLVDKLKEKFRRFQTQQVVRKIAELLEDDPDQALELGLHSLSEIQFQTSTESRFTNVGESFQERVDQYSINVLEQAQNPRQGIHLIDDIITEYSGGIMKKETGIIGAPPNTGKSFLLAVIALYAARNGWKVYYASLENDKELSLMRLDALWTGIPYVDYEQLRLSMTDFDRLKDKLNHIDELGGRLILDTPDYRHERSAYEIYTRAQFFGADLVVGDQISWVTPRKSTGDKTGETIEVIEEIVELTKEQNMASIWANQLNRQAQSGTVKARLDMFKNTSVIEEIANWAWAIERTGEMRQSKSMVLRTLKARRRQLKDFVFDWDLESQTRIACLREYED